MNSVAGGRGNNLCARYDCDIAAFHSIDALAAASSLFFYFQANCSASKNLALSPPCD